MGWIRKIGLTLWRIWFYILMAVPIILMFPLILLFTSKASWYPYFFRLARFWAKVVLFGMGFFPILTKKERIERKKSYMFVANHTSMTDIMLMLYCVKNPFVFVGKKELVHIPVFGWVYKRSCILVDRKSPRSRKEVFDQAQARLNQGLSICIFPEGGVSDDESIVLDTFKDGAFRLAIDHQIPIAPLVFFDNKRRFPFTFYKGSPGKMRAEVLVPVPTQGLAQEHKPMLKEKVRNLILDQLRNDF